MECGSGLVYSSLVYSSVGPVLADTGGDVPNRPRIRSVKIRSLLLVAVVVLHAGQTSGQDLLQSGIDAYRRGDYPAALKAFRILAERGNANGQNTLGILYGRGLGVAADHAEAVKWFRKAAEQGYATAQHNLGSAYFRGRGVPADDAEALKWFRKAAAQGHAASQHNLGFAYFTGKGVPADNAKAARWFRLAAERGLARAQYNLGHLYDRGYGVPRDDLRAFVWASLAAEQGYVQAAGLRDAARRRLSPAELARADDLIGKIWERIRALR
ncbi:MAG: sel1 repeat family protein [Rhodospirillaceae bacterium]|nr:sel1 repeat family protein [Rhodospirillaceae bacterium]